MIYRFADCELDTGRYELRCQGVLKAVEPRVFDLLQYLLENRDRTITKDELYKAIWQGRFVSESALSSRIKAARQAVNDTGEDQGIIRTVHGRGFRFVAEVEPADGDRQERGQPPRGETKVSVAVLPFANMSGDPEQEYFSDGITEDLTTDLSRISGLFVPARNSTFRYKGAAVDVQQLCKDLGVRHVLEGSVRKAGGRVRITAQLIDGETGGHLWADRYDRDLTDVFIVQDEITHRIVESLRVTLLPSERKAIEKVPTENLEAYQYYLRGRQFFHQQTKNSMEIAKRMFERAIALDPNYARAYAGLADCESERYMGSYADVTPESILAASARALELDADLAEAHASRGLALSTLERHEEAEREFKAAMRLDPNLFEVLKFYARACQSQGRFAEAAEYFERACAASPDDIRCPVLLAQNYRDLGRRHEAEVALRRSLEKIERELQRNPERSNAAALGAVVLATLGETARARDWASMALSLDPDDLLTQYNTACAYALMGQAEAAIDLLERAIPRIRGRLQTRIRYDSDFNSLRSLPRFQALLKIVGG
ncbi:TPR end-of-group domain-containing protein [Dongia deserti]|uniref:TPR end-of-group domain-containing protein n=1 Tax=Dongia deserti TaxID=2268030 RepID=UPI0013C538E4|nr:tetratricopeptide repeat protein [Dongia deserti]